MSTAYYWNGKSIEIEPTVFDESREKHIGQFCVDTWGNTISGRYGKFMASGWFSVPLEEFPKEFRMHLLLLGVS